MEICVVQSWMYFVRYELCSSRRNLCGVAQGGIELIGDKMSKGMAANELYHRHKEIRGTTSWLVS